MILLKLAAVAALAAFFFMRGIPLWLPVLALVVWVVMVGRGRRARA